MVCYYCGGPLELDDYTLGVCYTMGCSWNVVANSCLIRLTNEVF